MEKHLISKSSFVRSLQCLKSLYLYRYHYKLRDRLSPEQLAVFNRGTAVGLLAQKLFPGGVDASPPSPSKYSESVIQTQQLMNQGVNVIYEAAFQFGQVMCAIDILVRKEKQWVAYEVKSSTKITEVYLTDASLQYWVMKNSGIDLEDMNIIYINNQYVKKGKIEIQGLFNIVSVREEAIRNQAMIGEKIALAKNVLSGKTIPDVPIGEHCTSPYACDFMGYCWKGVPENSILDTPGVQRDELFRLFHSGKKRMTDLPEESISENITKLHLASLRSKKAIADEKELKKFMGGLKYPLLYMDFETFMPAVPLYNGTRPYQQIPFQYSIHRREKRGGELTHCEFIADPGQDPRKDFIENLLKDTRGSETLLVYNATFEKTILKGLKADFPQFAEDIDALIARIQDLMIPFKNKHIYHAAMKGSASIKNVLPALVPELAYDDLKISNGALAMVAFEQLQTETDIFRIAETRDALLEYCKLDTLAMVRLLEVIENETRSH